MNTSDFDYDLPPECIAQKPVEPRDSARMLVIHRDSDRLEHRIFRDLPEYLRPGDVLVLNRTRVIPARLHGRKVPTGGAIEVLLLRRIEPRKWLTIVGGKRPRIGTRLELIGSNSEKVMATIVAEGEKSERVIEFDEPITGRLERLGEVPLPPYVHEPLDNPERYQTIYASEPGSAAAPTAGLHFTPELLLRVREMGVKIAYCTLHIGLDTFRPVTEENIEDHKMHSEYAVLEPKDAEIINRVKLSGGRVVAVGTTSVRTLETAALRSVEAAGGNSCPWRPVMAFSGQTDLFIYPGFKFRVVDVMITNFHLPRSTLIMLVSAFAGRERILAAYREAIKEGYRFYSFGDACLIL